MKVTELDTKNVQVTRTTKRYILNDKVFELDECPDWAQWAAVNRKGDVNWYSVEPYVCGDISGWWANKGRVGLIHADRPFDATDWIHSLIKRPERKALEVTMTELEKKCGCKIKIVKED